MSRGTSELWLFIEAAIQELSYRGRIRLIICGFVLAFTACNRVTSPSARTNKSVAVMANPYSAKPADVKWTRGPVLLNNLTLEPSAADSTHSTVKIAGEMPTPCHQLRLAIPDRADNDGTLRIEAWSVADPNTVCAQMMQPFSVQVQVPSSGVTSVSVNDQAVSRTR